MRHGASGEDGDCEGEVCCSGDEISDAGSATGNISEEPTGIASRSAVALIKAYQCISRLTPPVCKFRPTCSEYTRQAIVKYGLLKGIRLGAWRILRCNPFTKGGYDPVP